MAFIHVWHSWHTGLAFWKQDGARTLLVNLSPFQFSLLVSRFLVVCFCQLAYTLGTLTLLMVKASSSTMEYVSGPLATHLRISAGPCHLSGSEICATAMSPLAPVVPLVIPWGIDLVSDRAVNPASFVYLLTPSPDPSLFPACGSTRTWRPCARLRHATA